MSGVRGIMLLEEIKENLTKGNAPMVKRLVEKALSQGASCEQILGSLSAGMDIVGERFGLMEISLPEVLMSARAMHAGLEVLKPHMSKSPVKPRGLFAIGTVSGDIHDIGKNIVVMMLEGAGFSVIDLGTDVSVERFVSCVHEKRPDILGMSALLSVTMQNMRDVVEALESRGLRRKVKIIVGGAPVTQAFAEEIGADAYGEDGHDAVLKAKKLMETKK